MGILANIKNDIKNAGANKGKFVFIREGARVRLRFLQDMEDALEVVFHDNWEDRINFPCQKIFGRPCDGCGNENLRTRRFYVWSAYDYDENDVKLFMFAVNNCSPIPALAGMYEEYGTLLDRDFIIGVTGKQTNKTYSVVPADKNKFRNAKIKPYSKKRILEIIDKAYPADGETETEKYSGNASFADDEQKNPYAGMSARKMYDLCVERGIDVVTRKPENYYLVRLQEYDAQQDEWGDVDDESDQSDYDDEWADAENDGFMNIPESAGEELPFN